MLTLNSIAGVRQQVGEWRSQHQRIAFVPTMGNLHAGHLALVEQAKKRANQVVVSIFVNPLQFGPNEDFERYPRTLAADSEKLAAVGVALLFAPPLEEIYPDGGQSATRIEVSGVAEGLCADQRPGHFSGVVTVVCKLFNIVQPDLALFGEKDYQQLQVIRQMVADLCFPIEIIGVETMREADGLAMSSRNGYLSEVERAIAPRLYQLLQTAAQQLASERQDFRQIEAEMLEKIVKAGFVPEYFAIRQAENLRPATAADKVLRLLVAARLGRTRLIDNIGLSLLK